MDAMLSQITPVQLFFMFAIQIWSVVIFPIIVIRKMNYLTELLESQFEEDTKETGS